MIQTLKAILAKTPLAKKEDGVTLVEYALLLALIAIVCIVAVALIGTNASTTLHAAATSL
ncbi:MAG: Flp family type IVb pilin [Candidatus Eremiobacteraeota bacterium]|nr:Flp family type IVb pilin [Candidatus Eremiobacteraeota bacterium]